MLTADVLAAVEFGLHPIGAPLLEDDRQNRGAVEDGLSHAPPPAVPLAPLGDQFLGREPVLRRVGSRERPDALQGLSHCAQAHLAIIDRNDEVTGSPKPKGSANFGGEIEAARSGNFDRNRFHGTMPMLVLLLH